MRISSSQIFNIANQGMSNASQALAKTQEQMSTGRRVLTPSDDPVAATKILQLTDQLNSIGQYTRNIDIAENNLELEEIILSSANELIQRMQELAVRAGNTGTLGISEYQAMASEVDSRMDELQNLMNTRNANGDYIFGGYKSTRPPFVGSDATGYAYQGDEGQMQIKIASNATVATSDSGRKIFMDIDSGDNTFTTTASPANRAVPPARITLGQVVDQTAYDAFYPEDIVITFNAESTLSPPVKNFTATERSTGRVIIANEPFRDGMEIEMHGAQFRIMGAPASGAPAQPATRLFGAELPLNFPADFSGAASQTFTLNVGGRTERLVLDSNITSVADLANTLNNPANGNANRLVNLGITVTEQGFIMPQGVNFRVDNGSPAINSVLGLNADNGSASTNGIQARPGDRFLVESTEQQGLLTTLSRFKNALQNYDPSQEGNARMEAVVASTLKNLTNAQNSVSSVVTEVGARRNTLDATREIHLDTELVTDEMLKNLRDLDYAEATARFAQQTLVLEAAQRTFLRVSQLSLFSQM